MHRATIRAVFRMELICLAGSSNVSQGRRAQSTPGPAAQLVTTGWRPGHRASRRQQSSSREHACRRSRSAVKAGADLVELDYYHCGRRRARRVSRQHELDRTTNAVSSCGVAAKMQDQRTKTLAELKHCSTPEIGSIRTIRRVRDIPTLAEALDGRSRPGRRRSMERKGGDPAACVELLQPE